MRLFLTTLLLATIASAGETEWPEFRGPGRQGISAAVDVPVEWSATQNVAWKVEVPGRGWSSPVLSQGKIYLTSAQAEAGEETTLHALCFSADTGALVWNTEVFKPAPSAVAAIHPKNSPASATPIVSGGRVYVHFGHMGTAALDLDGKIIWQENELTWQPTHGNGGSPALVGDELIFSGDGAPDPFVAALEAATGKVRWRTPRHTTARKLFSFGTPLAIEVDGHTQVISTGSGFVGAYDPADGHEIWRVRYGEGYSVVPRPVFADGLLFIGTGFDAAWVYAIRPQGAAGDVTDTNVVWKVRKGAPLTPSMLVVGKELYYVSDNGIATCSDAATGEVHWAERLGGDFSASPVFADGRLYFLNESGVGYVLQAGTTYQPLAKNELGERALASYAVTDGALIVRTESHLWRIGK